MTFTLLRPKHTFASVVQELLTGLQDGTIVFESNLRLFPEFREQLQAIIERDEDQLKSLLEFLPVIVDRLAQRQTEFVSLVTTLESFLQLLQQLRQSGNACKADLVWYRQSISPEPNSRLGITSLLRGSRPHTDNVARLGKVLELALDQHETAVVSELTIQLQLAVVELLKNVLKDASTALHSEIEIGWKSIGVEKRFALSPLLRTLEEALGSAARSRYSDLDARTELLRLSLIKEQASAQNVIDGMRERREPHKHG